MIRILFLLSLALTGCAAHTHAAPFGEPGSASVLATNAQTDTGARVASTAIDGSYIELPEGGGAAWLSLSAYVPQGAVIVEVSCIVFRGVHADTIVSLSMRNIAVDFDRGGNPTSSIEPVDSDGQTHGVVILSGETHAPLNPGSDWDLVLESDGYALVQAFNVEWRMP